MHKSKALGAALFGGPLEGPMEVPIGGPYGGPHGGHWRTLLDSPMEGPLGGPFGVPMALLFAELAQNAWHMLLLPNWVFVIVITARKLNERHFIHFTTCFSAIGTNMGQ